MTATSKDPAVRVGRATFAAIMREREGNPAFRLTEVTLVECLRAPLAIEYPAAKKTGRNGKGRDELFDAIGTACGCDLTGLTREYAKQIATAKRDILEATPDVTPDEVARRALAYRKKYTNAACSPMALANHWPEFGNNERLTRGAKNDIYTEPQGWRAAALRRFPDAKEWINPHDFSTKPWAEVSHSIRPDILKAL